MRPTSGKYTYFAGEDFEAISIFLIVLGDTLWCLCYSKCIPAAGLCILAGSVLGVYGVFNDVRTLIYLYSYFLFCVIMAQAAVTLSTFSLR